MTDLTNTKWIFNNSVDVSTDVLYGVSISYHSEFFGRDVSSHYINIFNESIIYSIVGSGTYDMYTTTDGWRNDDRGARIITIEDGDVTNPDLINFLQTNARQVAEISDLTNTIWHFDETLDFSIIPNADIGAGLDHVFYNDYSFITNSILHVMSSSEAIESDENEIYAGLWTMPLARTIRITGGTDATNTDLINFIQANAKLIDKHNIYNTTWHFNDALNIPSSLYGNHSIYWSTTKMDHYDDSVILDSDGFTGNRSEGELYYSSADQLWYGHKLRNITIVGGADIDNEDLIKFLRSNAQQVFKVTNIDGTTWYFDNELDLSSYSSTTTYHIESTIDSTVNTEFTIYITNNLKAVQTDNLGPLYRTGPYWYDNKYRTITITGGVDVTNPDLINFLQTNAVMVLDYIDLTGTAWTLSGGGGLYKDNYFINFTSNNHSYTSLNVYNNKVSYDDTIVYNDSWVVDDAYRTITITGGFDATNHGLIYYLMSSAAVKSLGGKSLISDNNLTNIADAIRELTQTTSKILTTDMPNMIRGTGNMYLPLTAGSTKPLTGYLYLKPEDGSNSTRINLHDSATHIKGSIEANANYMYVVGYGDTGASGGIKFFTTGGATIHSKGTINIRTNGENDYEKSFQFYSNGNFSISNGDLLIPNGVQIGGHPMALEVNNTSVTLTSTEKDIYTISGLVGSATYLIIANLVVSPTAVSAGNRIVARIGSSGDSRQTVITTSANTCYVNVSGLSKTGDSPTIPIRASASGGGTCTNLYVKYIRLS